MSDIQRYDPIQKFDQGGYGDGECVEMNKGEFVRYDDHKREVDAANLKTQGMDLALWTVLDRLKQVRTQRKGHHCDYESVCESAIGTLEGFKSRDIKDVYSSVAKENRELQREVDELCAALKDLNDWWGLRFKEPYGSIYTQAKKLLERHGK